MAPTCWGLLNAVELGGFEQLQNHLQFRYRGRAIAVALLYGPIQGNIPSVPSEAIAIGDSPWRRSPRAASGATALLRSPDAMLVSLLWFTYGNAAGALLDLFDLHPFRFCEELLVKRKLFVDAVPEDLLHSSMLSNNSPGPLRCSRREQE